MKWTFEMCKLVALKYEYKIDFLTKDKNCYQASYKHGWLDEITKHMKINGDKFNRCIYVYEFSDNHVYVGLTGNIKKRNEQHLSICKSNNSQVIIHMKKTGLIPILKQLTDFLPYWQSSIKESVILEKYIKSGWITLNKNKTGSLGASNMFYTHDKCKEILKKVKTLIEVYKNYPGLLIQCRKNKWCVEEIENLKRFKKPNGYWTLNRCLELITKNKYQSLKEFTTNHSSAYRAAKKNNFLEDITNLLSSKKRKGYWTKQTCFEESKKYKNKFSFQKGSRGAYKAAYENGWLNVFF